MELPEVNSFRSSYITKHRPDAFGGQQSEYEQKATQIIQKAVKTIQTAVQQNSSLQNCFSEIVETFANERHSIAEGQETTKGQLFGIRRDKEETFSASPFFTVLNCQYEEYGKRWIKNLCQYMKQMKHTNQAFTETSKKMSTQISSFAIEIYNEKRLEEEKITAEQANSDILKELGIPSTSSQEMKERQEKQERFYQNKQKVREFKKGYPQRYMATQNRIVLTWLVKAFPSPNITKYPDGSHDFDGNTSYRKSDFIFCTSRGNNGNDQMVALSRYVTWTYRTFNDDPVDRLKKLSQEKKGIVVTVIHQDVFLIEPTLQRIASIFEQAMRWNKERQNKDDLMKQVGKMRYLFAHCMPFYRGSAAIGEWLETAIYHSLGFKHFCIDQNTLMDLEALTAFYEDNFLERYQKITAPLLQVKV